MWLKHLLQFQKPSFITCLVYDFSKRLTIFDIAYEK